MKMITKIIKRNALSSSVRNCSTNIEKAFETWKSIKNMENRVVRVSAISNYFNVSRTTLGRWVKKFEENGIVTRKGRPLKLNEEQTKKLKMWINKKLLEKKAPSIIEILDEANHLIREFNLQNFGSQIKQSEILSRKWVYGWVKRNHCFILDCKQTKKEKPPIKDEELTKYFFNLRFLIQKHRYKPGLIFNMDETAIYNNTSTEKIKVVTTDLTNNPIRNIPQINFHITAVVTVANDGTSLNTLMLDKRRTIKQDLVDNSNYTRLSFRKKIGENENALLIIDGAPSHRPDEGHLLCEKSKIQILFLPANSSHLLQPCDVVIFKGLKSYLKQQLFPTKYESFIENVSDGLQISLTRKKIHNSFEYTYITPFKSPIPLPNLKTQTQLTEPIKNPRISLGGDIVTGKNFREIIEKRKEERKSKRIQKEQANNQVILLNMVNVNKQDNKRKRLNNSNLNFQNKKIK
ncbi:protein derived from transposon [Anaeramoeba flamelloides]|uniref:Protein derived from transposon n=1 Tax=Anaeramoeba flamelloides TaxID=1746091 RepID=A0AAV7ZGH1_9EUKA|nr:protein derived from transposon [Anaeramoeba flamelloides]